MHHSSLVYCCVSISLLLSPRLSLGQEFSPESDGRPKAVELFESVAANWRHLENYDLRVVEKRYSVDDSKAIVSQVDQRLIADHRKNRYLFAVIHSQMKSPDRWIAAYYWNADTRESWRLSAGEKTAMRLSVSPPGKFSETDGLAQSHFFDVRLSGTGPYPTQFMNVSLDECFSKSFKFTGDLELLPLDSGKFEVVETYPTGKISRAQRRYTFDKRGSVPVRFVFINSARDGTNPLVTTDESIKWAKSKGLYLPREIRGTSQASRGLESERYVVTFEWLVVNDAAKLPPMNVGVISDDDALWELVDEH